MGKLLAEGRMTQRDLEWAARNGFNSQFRRAAQTLLGASPPNPGTAAPGPRDGPDVIVAGRYLEEQFHLRYGLIMFFSGWPSSWS
jgi:hypothetical protein